MDKVDQDARINCLKILFRNSREGHVERGPSLRIWAQEMRIAENKKGPWLRLMGVRATAPQQAKQSWKPQYLPGLVLLTFLESSACKQTAVKTHTQPHTHTHTQSEQNPTQVDHARLLLWLYLDVSSELHQPCKRQQWKRTRANVDLKAPVTVQSFKVISSSWFHRFIFYSCTFVECLNTLALNKEITY